MPAVIVDAEPQFPALHIGAHHGKCPLPRGRLPRRHCELGRTSGIVRCGRAVPDHRDLRDTVGDLAGGDYISLPPRRLKGIAGPIRLVEVGRRVLERSGRETDPVCGMLVGADEAAARITGRGTTFVFCSEMCEQAFAEDPIRFVAVDRD